MKILFLDDSSTFYPQDLPEPASPLHAAPGGAPGRCDVGEGRKPLISLQAPVHAEVATADDREEGGFRELPRPHFPKRKCHFPG